MKLNHDCVRDVMLSLEDRLECVDSIDFENIKLENFDDKDVLYSLLKLHEAGFLSGKVMRMLDRSVTGYITGITWEGHKFLDTIRDNKVWGKTKTILSKVSSASVSFASSVASQVLATLISQYMGLNQPLSLS